MLAWVLLGGLVLLRMLLGPWEDALLRLAIFVGLYLVVRTGIVARRGVPAWVEYSFLFFDATLVSAAVWILGGMESDIYLAYFFVLAEGVLTLDLRLVASLGAWVTLGYVVATWPAALNERWVLVYRLFFVLLASVGAAWVADREAAHWQEVGRLREQLLLEEERRRLAREIHDGLGHILAAGAQSLELAERLLPSDPQRVGALLPDVKRLLRQGLDEIRLLVRGLQPPGPSAGDAVAAARQHLAALSARAEITTEVRSQEREIPLSPTSEFTFRRILQEALTNVARHARAGRVTVTLARSGSSVTCSVADDGIGLASSERPHTGFGLQHMRERAMELGGSLDVSASSGGGTTVTFTLPCQASSRPEGTAP